MIKVSFYMGLPNQSNLPYFPQWSAVNTLYVYIITNLIDLTLGHIINLAYPG